MQPKTERQKDLTTLCLRHGGPWVCRVMGRTRVRVLVSALGAAAALVVPVSSVSQNISSPSEFFNYQRLKLDRPISDAERDRLEFARRKEAESLRLDSYANQLAATVFDYRAHIADQHQRYTSCKQCRQLVKRIGDFSRKIERGSR
jgi:hypothetical protein